MEHAQARAKIETRVRKMVDETPDSHTAYFLVHSGSRDIHWKMAVGNSGDAPVDPDQPYYPASVGKTFTATIILMLAQEGNLRLDDPISLYLSDELLDGLHIYRGTEYTDDIRIHHLLRHTSGLPHLLSDEFGLLNRRTEQSAEGKTFFDVMLEDPDRFWEPEEPIEWAKNHLHPHFTPGGGIYYSEVGYNILGLIIESVTSKSYHDVLHDYLFNPLSMKYSYLSQFSDPAVENDLPVASVYIDDEEFAVEQYRCFSAWFAGGQTVNTTEDLLKFHRSLMEGDLLQKDTFEAMTEWKRLSIGMDYGYGLFRFRPLPFLSKYYVLGGLGSTSSFMIYNPRIDVYLIGTFNQTSSRRRAFRFVLRVLRTVSKIDQANNGKIS